MLFKKLGFWTIVILFLIPRSLFSDVITGTAELTNGFWDFYTMESLTWQEGGGHAFVPLMNGVLVVAATNGSFVAAVPDSGFEELQYAPADSTQYYYNQVAVDGRIYVYKITNITTREVTYAKVRFLRYSYPVVLDYVYQPDGSRKLFNDVGIDHSTWSMIKALIY